MMNPNPPLKGGFYYHYKHDPNGALNNYSYEVAGIARNTEDKSYAVLYRPLYKSDWFSPADYQARPLAMFMETIEKDGLQIPRFSLITDKTVLSELRKIKKEIYGA